MQRIESSALRVEGVMHGRGVVMNAFRETVMKLVTERLKGYEKL